MISIHIAIFLLAIIITVSFVKRSGIPSTIGYVLTGLLIAPLLAMNLGQQPNILSLHEFALCLVAFFIGFRIQPERLWYARAYIKSSTLYITSLGSLFALLTWSVFQLPITTSLLIGFAFTLSSQILVKQLLEQHTETKTLAGQFFLNTLNIQILFATILLAIVPLLSTQYGVHHSIAYLIALIAIVSGLLLFNRYILKPLFRLVAQKSIPELTIVLAAFVILSIFTITQMIGMPLLFSALLSGIILSDSDLRLNIQTHIEPFFGLVFGLFFLSMGLMIDLNHIVNQVPMILIGALAIAALKLIGFVLIMHFKHIESNLRSYVIPAQTGEFALLILACAAFYQVIPTANVSALIMLVMLSMLVTPLLVWIIGYLRPSGKAAPLARSKNNEHDFKNHIAIIGYGRFGQIIARIAHLQQNQFTIVDNNFDQLDFIHQYGGQYIKGDATQPALLDTLSLDRAKLCVLTVDDVEDSLFIARHIRLYYPELPLIVRARDRHHAHVLDTLGIKYIYRETHFSALVMSKQMLILMGMDAAKASEKIEEFSNYDESLLFQQQHTHHSSDIPTDSTQQLLVEIENLFENDAFVLGRKYNTPSPHLDDLISKNQ